jgi:PAS domain S-box-containing protein
VSEAAAAAPVVRVAVLEPALDLSSGPSRLVEALTRLGAEAQIEVFDDPTLARTAFGPADLLVVDHAVGGAVALAWIAAARAADAGPLLAIVAGDDDAWAVEAFRNGASDCIQAGPELPETLPAAALDQLRRRRAQHEERRADRLGRRVDALSRNTRRIIDEMNSALLVADSEGRIAYANPLAAQVLDVEASSLISVPLSRFFLECSPQEPGVQRTLELGERFRGHETMLNRADGRAIPVGLSSAPLQNEDGEPEGAIVIFQDLTGIKQLQRQVLQTEKMASIGQLAAGIAHEINNPMGFIHANLCQLAEYLEDLGRVWEVVGGLRRSVAAGEPEATQAAAVALTATIDEVDADFLIADCGKAVRESLEGSARIRAIVKDLRAFSHHDSPEPVLADVNRALDSTANIVWAMMKHSVVLTKSYDELPPIPCYPMRLQQVFMNLLMNANQAIEEQVASRGGRGEIKLRTALEDRGVRVTVSDNGVGIAAEALPRIFDPFFTTKEIGDGTGLGLSTSYQLIELHGGTMRVESEPGTGTSFEVWLPLEAPTSEPT